jgi:hypothetical protein
MVAGSRSSIRGLRLPCVYALDARSHVRHELPFQWFTRRAAAILQEEGLFITVMSGGPAPSGSRSAAHSQRSDGTLSGVVSAAAVPSVCPTPRERRPGDSAEARAGKHEPAERRGLLLCHALAQPLVGLAPVIATSATPVVEVVLDAAANPAVVGKHRAAVGGEPVRRPIGSRARARAIRAFLDFAGGSGIAAIRLDRMHSRRAARNAENAEGEPATCRKPDSDPKPSMHFSLPSRKGNRCRNRLHQLRASPRGLIAEYRLPSTWQWVRGWSGRSQPATPGLRRLERKPAKPTREVRTPAIEPKISAQPSAKTSVHSSRDLLKRSFASGA